MKYVCIFVGYNWAHLLSDLVLNSTAKSIAKIYVTFIRDFLFKISLDFDYYFFVNVFNYFL